MKRSSYKILVLSDLKSSTDTTLKSTVNLAKMIGGSIVFFHVKKPIDIIKQDNQLSAMRTINTESKTANKNIKALVKKVSRDSGVKIDYRFALGNVKNEIANCIDDVKPDIVVLGKRKSKPFSIIGDKITQYVLKKHKGVVLIISEDHTLDLNKLSIGVLDDIEKSLNTELADYLIEHSEQPVKSFKVGKDSKTLKETSFKGVKTVDYVFEVGDNTIKNLSNYMSKNKINLLCVNRGGPDRKGGVKSINLGIKEVINNLNVSLLLTSA